MSKISDQLKRLEVFFSAPSKVFKKEVEFATGRTIVDDNDDTTPKFIKQRQERLNRAKKEIMEINSKLLDYNENDDILLFVRLVQKKNRSAK